MDMKWPIKWVVDRANERIVPHLPRLVKQPRLPPFVEKFDFLSNRLVNVVDPVNDQDATTRNYVDNLNTGRGATIVIAANDSSAKAKAQADYLCDGEDDDVTIQSVIDAISEKDSIFLLYGVYNVSSAIDMKGRSIYGESQFGNIIEAQVGGTWDTGGEGYQTAILYSRVQDYNHVENLTIDGQGEDAGGVTIFGGSYNHIERLYVYDTVDDGIGVFGNSLTGEVITKYTHIINNIIEKNNWAVVVDGSNKFLNVIGNLCIDSIERGISIDNDEGAKEEDTRVFNVSNNVIVGSPTIAGIHIQRAAGRNVYGNVNNNYIFITTAEGIIATMDGGSISNNIIHQQPGGTMTNMIRIINCGSALSIQSNTIIGGDTGIVFNAGDLCKCYDNHIHDTDVQEYDITATYTIINGMAVESADAEEPQVGWPIGTTVKFTDSGDGSGDGTYIRGVDGNWINLA